MDIFDSQSDVVRASEYTVCKFGKARSGKTLSSVLEAVYLAQIKWSKLCFDYEVFKKRSQVYENKHDERFQADLKEITKSYNFWINRPEFIPCLLSNVKIKMGNQYSIDLHRGHFDQEVYSPSYCVWLYDEIGSNFGMNESSVKEKPERAANMMRFIGQYIECNLKMTEQRPDAFPIDFRGVTGVFESVEKLEKINLAYFALDFIDRRLQKAIKKQSHPETFERLYRWRKWFDKVGFFKFTFETQGNIDHSKTEPKQSVKYFFKNMICEYETRAYRNLYLAKDYDPEYESYCNMLLDENSPVAKKMYERYKKEMERKYENERKQK